MSRLVAFIRKIVKEELENYTKSSTITKTNEIDSNNYSIAHDAINYLNKVHKLDFKCSEYNLKAIVKSINDGDYTLKNFKQVVDASIGITNANKLRPAKIFSRASMAKFNFSSTDSKINLSEYDF